MHEMSTPAGAEGCGQGQGQKRKKIVREGTTKWSVTAFEGRCGVRYACSVHAACPGCETEKRPLWTAKSERATERGVNEGWQAWTTLLYYGNRYIWRGGKGA